MNETARSFLGVTPPNDRPPRVRILPIPYEATVSYEHGAADGPGAIITASQQVELYDLGHGEAWQQYGCQTLPEFRPDAPDAQHAVQAIQRHAASHIQPGGLLVGLGGEHTVTVGLMRAAADSFDQPLTLVQIDAHADLRDAYEGNPYSHACMARRLLDAGAAKAVQVGIRSLCTEEADYIDTHPGRVAVFSADRMMFDTALDELRAEVAGKAVYLSIDVDGLDPSVIPATGTPEPGGLSWRQALATIDAVCQAATVVGLDCVELAPRPGLHMADFATAKLVYLTINRIAASRGWLSA